MWDFPGVDLKCFAYTTGRLDQVPGDPPSNTVHPSTAHGIAHVRILTSSQTLTTVSRQLTSVIGDLPAATTDTEVIWILDTVHERQNRPKLVLSSPKNGDEFSFVGNMGTGIYEVAFRVDRGEDGGSGTTPYGKIVWTHEDFCSTL